MPGSWTFSNRYCSAGFNRQTKAAMSTTIAKRIARLGTETAFSVSGEAAVVAATGRHIYPFHLGDMNLPTPSVVVDASIKAIRDGRTG